MINHKEMRMNYDELAAAEKIALAELALKIRQIQSPHDRQGNFKSLEQLIKETAKTAREFAEEL